MADNNSIMITVIQKQIWEAQYFISINANKEYYQGKIDGLLFVLDGFRSVGISISEVTKNLQNPYQ